MACTPEILKDVPLFTLLDQDELTVLSSQVEHRKFTARQRIYKMGEQSGRAYVIINGSVVVSTVDSDGQEVTVDQPGVGEFFGFASMIEGIPHQTTATAITETECIEIDRNDIEMLLSKKPHAGIDLLTQVARQFHTTQQLVRVRSQRDPNEVIEEHTSFGQRIADGVAQFGGSWSFIITFGIILIIYSGINVWLASRAWDPYPFILLNLFLSMLAAIQAPVIMMSQNRQDMKDRLRSELDFDVNKRAANDIQGLARKMNLMAEKIDDLEELVREKK
ncbi:cyclic nucleotide-binding protein [Candidatus Koribacter versatilis Ellin345]|uniref:Cyclic nucleotide-binding protein n=1 Tax=Koribacter versatilis (strain Ellin345) TaxID=204669 RepID=Q1ISL7_KORVE|nr:DUF1003 domain-containing protein [Candidatus Koribacter versatilis]ABF40133.1 cyclic nucleotide-binding protein [Candidatus Koribacter versatilis Ellin345]